MYTQICAQLCCQENYGFMVAICATAGGGHSRRPCTLLLPPDSCKDTDLMSKLTRGPERLMHNKIRKYSVAVLRAPTQPPPAIAVGLRSP